MTSPRERGLMVQEPYIGLLRNGKLLHSLIIFFALVCNYLVVTLIFSTAMIRGKGNTYSILQYKIAMVLNHAQ